MQDSDQTLVDSIELARRVQVAGRPRKPFRVDSKPRCAKASAGEEHPLETRIERNALRRDQHRSGDIIGSHGSLRRIIEKAEQVAPLPITVLITGESGTGKELLARLLHRASTRRSGPLITVNCAAMPEALVESELFGHEKGAFTGALARRVGKFELASGGTLFLDEIGELSASAQPKLLRVLQDKAVARLGGHEDIPVDVRLIAATNRTLKDEIDRGSFREDLYYRLSVVELRCPPLRERKADIPTLVQHFIDRYRDTLEKPVFGVSPAAMQRLCCHDWPGNIRELENVIAHAIALATSTVLSPQDIQLPARAGTTEPQAATGPISADPFNTLLEICGLSTTDLTQNGFVRIMHGCERVCLQSMLARTRNQKEAADALGLTPSKLHRLIKKHSLKIFKSEMQN